MSNGHSVKLSGGGINGNGATFWNLDIDTRHDGRGVGGLRLSVDIHTQTDGLSVAGELITWDDLDNARKEAEISNQKLTG